MKKPLFKGNGKPSHLSTGRRSRKGSGLWLINVAVMLGVGVVIFFIIFFLTNFGMLSTELHEMDDEHFVQTVQEDYYPPERLAQTLAQPRHSPYIVMRVTKLIERFHSPQFPEMLYEVAGTGDDDVLIPSLALCRLGDMRGLERIVMLAKELNPDEPSDELLRANLFSAYHQYVNPLYKEYSADNDLEFLLKIAEVSTGQKFEGDDLAERRDALLQWWTEHRNEQTVPEND